MKSANLLRTMLALMLALCGTPRITSAQTVQLGFGMTESSNYNSSPVNIYYRRTVCQFVYTAAELQAAGASTTAPITSLGFYVTQSPIYTIRQYTIKLKHVAVNDVSSPLGTTGWTTVKNAFNYNPTAGGYDMITMDNGFTWDGVSSIGVEICWARTNPWWNPSGKLRTTPTANGYRYSWTDAGGTSCGSVPATVTSDKPQMQMVFVPGTSTTWNGSVNTDWFNSGNWSAGVPTKLMNAVVPAGPTNMPLINGSYASTNNISVAASASLTINASDSLTVYGNWVMNGTFTGNTSTVIFGGLGASANLLDGANNQQFYNLNVESAAGINLNTGTYNIQGSVRLKGGNLVSNDRIKLISNATGTGRLSEIRNLCNYQLVMNDAYGDGWNGGYLTVRVDGVVYGYYAASGFGSTENVFIPNTSNFTLEYNSGQYENENTYVLNDPGGTPIFSDGPNPIVGVVYSGKGNCAFSLPFTGNLGIQRYLNNPNDGWREMTAGVTGQTLSNWQDDGLTMTNFPGSDWPLFGWTSVYTYNENNANGDKNAGWVEATNITNPLDPSLGHRVYVGTGNYTTDIAGPPRAGDQVFTLEYQNIIPAEIAANENQKGWNLIGNPYACSFNWDSVPITNKVNMENSIWVWSGSAGNYGLYQGGTGGIGTNDVNADVASSQAFWVHATTTGASLTLNEAQKTENDPVFVRSYTDYDRIDISLTGSSTSFRDEAILVWRDGTSNGLDEMDGMKLFSYEPTAPSLSFVPDYQRDISINSIPPGNQATSVPMRVLVGLPGTYTLAFDHVDDLSEYSCVLLQDHVLDSVIDLKQGAQYTFNQDSGYSGIRFELHLNSYFYGGNWRLCEGGDLPTSENNSGMEEVLISSTKEVDLQETLQVYPNPSKDWVNIQAHEAVRSLRLLDLNGKVVLEFAPNVSKFELDVSAFASGMYLLHLQSDSGVATARVHLID